MEKCIYKITNNINKKVYIGQTNNLKKRWNEHKRLGNSNNSSKKSINSKLYSAMKKYGVENFTIEVIEEPTENYNEREKYWIKYYHSNERDKGYNIASGGEDPPIKKGEESVLAKYSDKIIEKIQNDLIYSNKTFDQISEDYNISCEYLSFINRGITRKNNDLDYPLRKHSNCRKDDEMVSQIVNDLLYTTLSIEKIAIKNNVSSKTIYSINDNNHYNCPQNVNYPIRKPFEKLSYYLIQTLIDDLKDNQLKMIDIGKKYNISISSVHRFNNGKIMKQDNLNYPIRSSKQRVYY